MNHRRNLILNDALTLNAIEKRMKYFHIGDEVSIPGNMLYSSEEAVLSEKKRPSLAPVRATVVGIYPHHILFQLKNGIKESVINFDCRNITIIKSAKNSSYSKEDELQDITDSLMAI